MTTNLERVVKHERHIAYYLLYLVLLQLVYHPRSIITVACSINMVRQTLRTSDVLIHSSKAEIGLRYSRVSNLI